MTTGFIIPTKDLINRIAAELKDKKIITQPDWALYVKTSHARENMPINPDWYYVRAGSVMRKIYFRAPIGIIALSKCYSSAKNRGSRPEHSVNASRKILRVILQDLEKAGFVAKDGANGRILSPKGISFVDKLSAEMKGNYPLLSQY